MEEKDLLHNPPKKVLLMYQAVIEMVREGCDINKMKVSDITVRAGIGKGTAYEYFSTKEELITKALAYDVEIKLGDITKIVESDQNFAEKLGNLLDYIAMKFCEIQTFCTLVRIGTNSYEVSENFKKEYAKVQEDLNCSRAEKIMDKIMQQGQKEGSIAQTNPARNRMALAAQMIAFATFMVSQKDGMYAGLSMEDAKQFTYNSLIKSLN